MPIPNITVEPTEKPEKITLEKVVSRFVAKYCNTVPIKLKIEEEDNEAVISVKTGAANGYMTRGWHALLFWADGPTFLAYTDVTPKEGTLLHIRDVEKFIAEMS